MQYTWVCQKCGIQTVVNRKIDDYQKPPEDHEIVCNCNDYKRLECEGIGRSFERQKGYYNSLVKPERK